MLMERNLRVLHLSESSGWSGGAAQALALAGRLEARGHENMIACPEGGDLWKKAGAAGLELYNFAPRRDYDLFCAYKLAHFIERWKPDVVHAHHPKAHAMGLMAKAITRRKPVFVVTRRVSHTLINTFFARLKYRNSLINGYITVARSIRAMFLAYGIPAGKIRTIYSGVDTGLFKPGPPSARLIKELALPPGVPVLGLVGNYSFDKGQHVFIEAASRLQSEGKKIILLLAGRDTDSQAVRELLAHKAFPLENTRLLGLRHDVPEILSVLSVSLNCAIKGEALSGSIRESMAAGIPVIASDISGNGELVQTGETGMLFPPGDDTALYGRLKQALSDPGALRAAAERGLALVREEFTVEVMVRKTFLYYRELLTRKLQLPEVFAP
jgi:glycosyltransferase involved in cell wall biosynthesis